MKSRFCLHASDGRTRAWRRLGERHLPEYFGPRGLTSGFMEWGPSVTTRGYICCFCRVCKTCTTAISYTGKGCVFQQDNARPHSAAATQRALRGVQQLLRPARSPDLSPFESVWHMMKWELTLSPEPATTIA